MFGFGPDVTAMSDEELMHKQVELHSRLSWAARFGGADTVQRLQQILTSIEAERQERAYRGAFMAQHQLLPEIIETDPDLAAQHKKEAEKPDRGNVTPNHRPKVLISRSARPVDPPPVTSTPVEPAPEPAPKDQND